MSGQHGNGTSIRVSKASPKQGPLKATIPMASLLKQSSGIRTNVRSACSPTSCWKARISPDQASGQRSPGSSADKVKSKLNTYDNSGSSMRRTVSLDTIYLKGQWPRDLFYWQHGTLQVDKTTQTEDSDWLESGKISMNMNIEENYDKSAHRQRIRSKEPTLRFHNFAEHMFTTSSQTPTSCIAPLVQKAQPVMIPQKPITKLSIRSSIEGLNQEIEGLVLRTSANACNERSEEYDKFGQVTPEGHRAPLAELLRNTRSRSVNTQTPSDCEPLGSCHLSGPPSRESLSPMMCRYLDSPYSDTGGSQGSSPDQEGSKLGTSPHINKFLAREPPDGCERVHLKTYDEKRSIPMEHMPQPCTFKLKPSLGSAFQILKPNLHFSSDRDSPLVPSQHNVEF